VALLSPAVFSCSVCSAGWITSRLRDEFLRLLLGPGWHRRLVSGRWPAIGVALGATVSWLLADYFGGVKYSAPFFYYWNSVIHFVAFIINAVTIAKIKNDLDQRHVLAAELRSAREALRAVSARLPACPVCGQRGSVPQVMGKSKSPLSPARSWSSPRRLR